MTGGKPESLTLIERFCGINIQDFVTLHNHEQPVNTNQLPDEVKLTAPSMLAMQPINYETFFMNWIF